MSSWSKVFLARILRYYGPEKKKMERLLITTLLSIARCRETKECAHFRHGPGISSFSIVEATRRVVNVTLKLRCFGSRKGRCAIIASWRISL